MVGCPKPTEEFMKKLLVVLLVLGASSAFAMDRPFSVRIGNDEPISSSGESYYQSPDQRAKELNDAIYANDLEEVKALLANRTYSSKELWDAYNYSKSPHLAATAGEEGQQISNLLREKAEAKSKEYIISVDPQTRKIL